MVSTTFIWGKNKQRPAEGEGATASKKRKVAMDPSPAGEKESSHLRRKKTSQPSIQLITASDSPIYCPDHIPNWRVKESNLSRNNQVARRMIHHFATSADCQVLAKHSSEAVEASLCKHLTQVVMLISNFSRRFAQASKRTLELDTQLHERNETVESQRKDLEELASERQSLGHHIQELEEELSRVNSLNRKYERKYAKPTKLPEVEEFIQQNLQEAWRKGFQAHATEVLRAHRNLDMSNVRSIEEIVAKLDEDSEMTDDEDTPLDA
ncbi:uncharacterized protein LOC127813432 [Diospyros lotus]|uniref:uncharacterized protein LOC127813432 n=1 Tax=Diospyros lotus TaxID=55363 RepID=UPI0022564C09|nr:uncharacterized protein LOC127813432 [Diospyros lotus]